ncbi:MAG: uncharacterized protein A8A55_2267, partial [Amphiamblys sp. WSBS2006]
YNEARNPGSREARIVDDITRANGEGPNTKANMSRVIAKKKEMLRLVDERETSREDRKRFVKENQMFELNRQGFYRNLQDKTADSEAPAEEVRRYWQQLWTEKEDDCAQQDNLRLGNKPSLRTPAGLPRYKHRVSLLPPRSSFSPKKYL